ncbi:MAG: isoleucine--tRNA ligase [Bacilli bacterium]
MEVKKSLTMPNTAFEMRGNLANKEPVLQKKWEEMHLYEKVLEKNKNQPPFRFHDGPPFANGDIHCGHALNKILKDFIVRYKSMSGYYTHFIPGWDTHGLPIETALAKKGVKRKTMELSEYRKLCEKYALEQVNHQMAQFKRLGLEADFDHCYITLQHDYEAKQIEVFAKMVKAGMIFRGKKPVFWSPSSESALAEAEIEYYDVTSSSIYVAFKVSKKNQFLRGDESFIIWTTTPWTIPANLAICLNAKYDYGVFETDQGVFIFLKEFENTLPELLGLTNVKLRTVIKGSDLEGVEAKHPLYERSSVVILGDHVTNDAGTGCVHTAPGHGEDDYKVGRKYGLPAFCPVDDKGFMTAEAGVDFAGLFYEDCNTKVLEKLQECGALMKETKITHAYPHDWRTKKPVIFRATDQWFCSIDKIRNQLLTEIHAVKWYPSWGEVRLGNMIADRDDWCISRQRAWGVPLPIIYNEDGSPIFEDAVFAHISDLFRQYGSNIWYEKDVKDLLPSGYHNPKSPHDNYKKEKDIMDVWFDSGSSHTTVMDQRGLGYPIDLYLEGSDQYRGWFNSSLIIGTVYHNECPFRSVVSHGFVLDGKGQAMSKSLGNTIDPNKFANSYGADIIRLWVGSVDYQQDVRISEDIIKQIAEQYRKIRNTLRFVHGNLSDGSFGHFDAAKDNQKDLELVDQFVINKLHSVINQCLDNYDHYNFLAIITVLENFLANDLSSFYLDIGKDVLYCDEFDSKRRRQYQTVLHEVLDSLLRLLAPILPHTMEELYQLTSDKSEESVHLLSMVKPQDVNEEVLKEYTALLKLRTEVLKALEESRSKGEIGSAQEARLQLDINDKYTSEVFNKMSHAEQVRFFIVSDLELVKNNGLKQEVSQVKVLKDEGIKCERCWNRYPANKVNAEHLCERCEKAFKKAAQHE